MPQHSQAAKAIEPGSTASGDRQTLEAGLGAVLGGDASGQGGGPPPAPGAGGLTIPEDPIGALLSGEAPGNPDIPLSDGLDLGPGAGAPNNNIHPAMKTSRADRVRDLAMNASTPMIRQAARNELRRMMREPV